MSEQITDAWIDDDEHKPCAQVVDRFCVNPNCEQDWPCRDYLIAALAAAEARAAAAEQRADAEAQDWDSERLAYRRIARAYVGLLESDYPESHWGENYHQAVALLAAQQGADGHEYDGACRNVQHADNKCACNHPVNGRRCGQSRYAPIHRDAAPTAAPGATDE